jgi:hypothetical protein
MVGLFGTPIESVDRTLFQHTAIEFAQCVRAHGVSDYPVPTFGGEDPVQAFWRLPFDWSNHRFVSAVLACVEPLRTYLFSS